MSERALTRYLKKGNNVSMMDANDTDEGGGGCCKFPIRASGAERDCYQNNYIVKSNIPAYTLSLSLSLSVNFANGIPKLPENHRIFRAVRIVGAKHDDIFDTRRYEK